MNCYFCNLPATKEMYYYKCYTCNSYNYYDSYHGLQMVRLYHKFYIVILNFKYKIYSLCLFKNSLGLYKPIYVWQSIPNITPQNIESKINTILAFM